MILALLAPPPAAVDGLTLFVTDAYVVALDAIQGDFGQLGLAIFGILLTWHVLLGGAELATGDPNCRFLKAGFYVRFLTVCGALLLVDTVLVTMTKTIAGAAATEMNTALLTPWTTASDTAQRVWDAVQAVYDANFGPMGVLGAGISVVLSVLFCVCTGLLCVIAYFLAAILMLVQAYVAIAYGAIVLCLAPVLLPFALHESTESIAWQYMKAWLIYGVLYLPVCIIAMKLATALMTVSALAINYGGLASTNGLIALVIQFLGLVGAPLAVIGIVFVPNAALNKVL